MMSYDGEVMQLRFILILQLKNQKAPNRKTGMANVCIVYIAV